MDSAQINELLEAFRVGNKTEDELVAALQQRQETLGHTTAALVDAVDRHQQRTPLPEDFYTRLRARLLQGSDPTRLVDEATRQLQRPAPSLGDRSPTRDETAAVTSSDTVLAAAANAATVATTQAETVAPSAPQWQQITQIDTSQQRPLSPGDVIKGRFVLEKVLGVGGMSVVFKALDLRKQEAQNRNPYVAMKVLGDEFKRHPDSLKVLERETQKAQSLAHPNIVTVYDFDREGNTVYMTMECLEGEALNAIIKRFPQGMPLKQALPYIEGMVRALDYAHKRNIIHCDFKPANVFYTKDNVVKVLDFGIARARKRDAAAGADETTGFDPGTLGALTPPYASCEMLEGQSDPDPRDDLYALGCITYELLSGRHPFHRLPANKAKEAQLKATRIRGLTRNQWSMLARTLAFDRQQRTADVRQFLSTFKPRRTRGQVLALGATFVFTLAGSYAAYRYFRPAPVVLTEEQQAQIADYLETADLYLDVGHLALPPGDSAFDMLRKVLEIDPLNSKAQQRIAAIADTYATQAREACDKGQWQNCASLADTGLRVLPTHDGLNALKERIVREQPLSGTAGR